MVLISIFEVLIETDFMYLHFFYFFSSILTFIYFSCCVMVKEVVSVEVVNVMKILYTEDQLVKSAQ